VEIGRLQNRKKGMTSAQIRERVMAGRFLQKKRYEGTGIRFNADLGAGDMEEYCKLEKAEKELLQKLAKTMDLSARAYHKILKVARTIADLEDSDNIKKEHLSEAVCYRGGEEFYEK
jgi:magnesium chelatase family protein